MRKVISQLRDLTVAGLVVDEALIADQGHHVLDRDVGSEHSELPLELPLGQVLRARAESDGRVAVNLVEVEGLAAVGVVPTLALGEVEYVVRAHEVATAPKVVRHGTDVAGVGGAHVRRPQSLRRPDALASGGLDHHPAFILVGDQVRVAAVGGEP